MQKGNTLCIRFFGYSAVLAACFLFSGRPALAGTADNVSGWLWSGTIGWISLNCTDLGTCAAADFGVTIEETPGFGDRGDLKGYAWSETVGWICFGVTCAGPSPEGGPSYAQYRASFSTTDGVSPDPSVKQDHIYGWAKVMSLGDRGWISLNCDKDNDAFDTCATSNYHLVLNTATSSSNFTKGQGNDHWGWSGNDDGTGIGWLEFTAFARTTWTLADIGTVLRPEGVYEPQNVGLVGTHNFTMTVRFQGFSAPQDDLLQCTLELPDGSKKLLSKLLPATVRNPPGVESLSYTVTNDDASQIQRNELWFLSRCLIAGDVTATACSDDDDCTVCNAGLCNVTGKTCVTSDDCDGTSMCDSAGASDFCRPVIDAWYGKRPIFTHLNTWTGLGGDQDQYLAIKCNAGFPAQYFNNPAQCDFEGDASFSLAMRRGVPIETDCHDDIDNDGNGQADCAGLDVAPPGPSAGDLPPDRYCQGISYRCKTLPPTTCFWGQTGDSIQDCSEAGYVEGDLCCTRQPISESDPSSHIVNGLECTAGDPLDGYFDCSCTSSGEFNASGTDDCFAPGYQAGDLCCSAAGEVVKL